MMREKDAYIIEDSIFFFKQNKNNKNVLYKNKWQ